MRFDDMVPRRMRGRAMTTLLAKQFGVFVLSADQHPGRSDGKSILLIVMLTMSSSRDLLFRYWDSSLEGAIPWGKRRSMCPANGARADKA